MLLKPSWWLFLAIPKILFPWGITFSCAKIFQQKISRKWVSPNFRNNMFVCFFLCFFHYILPIPNFHGMFSRTSRCWCWAVGGSNGSCKHRRCPWPALLRDLEHQTWGFRNILQYNIFRIYWEYMEYNDTLIGIYWAYNHNIWRIVTGNIRNI